MFIKVLMFIHKPINTKIMTKNQLLDTIANLGHKPIAFDPIPVENDGDELTKAINDPIYHDNHWDLHEDVDGEALQKFWEDATEDLESDVDSFTE